MNCSEALRVQRLLDWVVQLRGGGAGPVPGAPSLAPPPAPSGGRAGADDAYLYILVIMIFYGCLAGGLILAYTRSRKLESKHDPYHLYIERDWTAGGASPRAAPGARRAAARELSLEEGTPPPAAAREERRSSGDSEGHL